MAKNINQFWMEHGGTICAGFIAAAITVTMMTLPYIKYFLL